MRLQDGLRRGGGPSAARSAWRFFPWAICAALLAVIAVNIGMVYAALHTFPGQAGKDGFDLSNHYDAVIDHMQQQAALGWTLGAETDGAGRTVLTLADKQGRPLSGARINGSAERPLGEPATTAMAFQEQTPGSYLGTSSLKLAGQWDLSVVVDLEGSEFITTRRLIVR
jgi:nitrogen fixation protein FixH